MADRLQEIAVVDPVLTTLARGYKYADLVGTELAPIATVQKERGKIPQFGKEAFKLYNTARAIRAGSNIMSPEGITTIDFVLTEHDLGYPIDYREVEEAIFDIEAHGQETVQKAILLRLEKEIADLVQNLNSYPSGNKVTLTGNDQWTASHADSNPIDDVDTGKDAVRGKIGTYPNVMVLGPKSFKSLKNHSTIIEKIKYSMKGIVTVELLAEIFDIPTVVVGKASYATDAGTFTDIWSDNCILAYVPDKPKAENVERTPYEPSFAYTLRKKGSPQIDKYDTNGGKLHIVRCTDNLVAKLVGAEAGYIINDTNG